MINVEPLYIALELSKVMCTPPVPSPPEERTFTYSRTVLAFGRVPYWPTPRLAATDLLQ